MTPSKAEDSNFALVPLSDPAGLIEPSELTPLIWSDAMCYYLVQAEHQNRGNSIAQNGGLSVHPASGGIMRRHN